jgi:hypothetical protein
LSGIYLSGFTRGTLPDQTSSGDFDAFVRKYSYTGTPIWTRQFGTAGPDTALGVAAGMEGIYVTGTVGGSLSGQPYQGLIDGFVRKYDSDGNELWTRVFGTAFADEARRIALSSSGVYIAGTTSGAMDDPLLPQASAGGSDIYVRKYAHDGTHLWTRQFGSPSNDSAWGIAAYGSAVYVTGTGGPLPVPPFAGGVTDGIVRKYDSWGNVIWTAAVATPLNDKVWGVAVDGTGIYLSGDTQGALPGQTSAGDLDAFVVKLDTTPPNIQSVVPSQTIIWPPNNQMVPISLAVTATDAGTPNPVCRISGVSMNEPGSDEWQITGPLTLNLLASRNGNGNGRIYIITVTCSDTSGNSSSMSTTVTVPHDAGN